MAATREQLLAYCKKAGIFVPTGATKRYLEAAIVRATMHLKKSDASDCFGLWEKDNGECLMCEHKTECFEASIGMTREEYEKLKDREENPRPRFTKSLTRRNLKS